MPKKTENCIKHGKKQLSKCECVSD